jgi:hypothetical protein
MNRVAEGPVLAANDISLANRPVRRISALVVADRIALPPRLANAAHALCPRQAPERTAHRPGDLHTRRLDTAMGRSACRAKSAMRLDASVRLKTSNTQPAFQFGTLGEYTQRAKNKGDFSK